MDDILITGLDLEEIQHFKQCLNTNFGIKDLGQLHYFLGLEVAQTPKGVLLSQQKFTKELLRDCVISRKRHASTPLPLNCKLLSDEGDLLTDLTVYRTLVGKLNFLTHSRPDLSFTVQTRSQFLQNPRTSQLLASYIHLATSWVQQLKGSY